MYAFKGASDGAQPYAPLILDSAGDLAGWFGGTEIFRPAESFEERCRQVEAVSAAQIVEVARRTFEKRNLTVVAVGPKKTGSDRIEAALE